MSKLTEGIKVTGTPVALIASDWHVQLAAWKKFPEVKRDAEYSLEQIVDCAIEIGVPLIAPGDLFDCKLPCSYSVGVVKNQMERMRKNSLAVYYVQGQHEMSSPTWMSLFDGCVNVHDTEFNIGGIGFFGYDYFLPKSVQDSYMRFKKSDVLITHQVWEELLPLNGQEFCCSYNLINSRVGYSAIVSGDFHSHFLEKIGDAQFVSPGSICLQDLNEPPKKAAWLLCNDMSFTSIPYATRELISSTIITEDDLAKVLKSIESIKDSNMPYGIGRPLLKIRFSTKVEGVYDSITEACKGVAYVDFKQQVEDAQLMEISLKEDEGRPVRADDLFKEAVLSMPSLTERTRHDLFRLWNARSSSDLKEEIDSIIGEVRKELTSP